MCFWAEADHNTQTSPLVCYRVQSWASGCFWHYINDLPESVKASDPRLFADDCLLHKLIKCDADAESLQQDLQSFEEWEQTWQMKLHPEHCQVINIITNKRHEIQTKYSLHGHTLEVVDNRKYLGITISDDLSWHKHGITISDDLSWHKHVDTVAAKTSRTHTRVR